MAELFRLMKNLERTAIKNGKDGYRHRYLTDDRFRHNMDLQGRGEDFVPDDLAAMDLESFTQWWRGGR